ncbi:hypothetical protein CC1G_11887 [Coprinopsis cinerea okayama7|uniref:Enoyl reductase (ER) domain-containing protein n=1 Tax=Coprinopsis cinerea (strain Okayama-7 / 130 / ATCC MYA-4618 / FGSC 9003) TaxID=240176 RepID=A8P3J7_COPC7|nr:hypothetical protein CC1G_11887 [Coprinopsis cinerea okayama7\|eukprot:XP_001838558.2 hypothetical protein CC1G_11887 [Coprinopsis cinerea okayama7\
MNMTSDTHKALVLDKPGGDLVLMTRPIPKPLKDEVLVKVEAAGLNPVDWKIQRHGFFVDGYPALMGGDIAGEVVELGENVTKFSKGDKVVFHGTWRNGDESAGFQQYSRADVHTTGKLPPSIATIEAATIPIAFLCAYVGLYNIPPHGLGFEPPLTLGARGKYKDTPIFIMGGSSSVGQYAIQLAKASGFSPIITTASLKHSGYLKSLGPTDVLDRSLPLEDLQTRIKGISASPLKVVYDAVSSEETQNTGAALLGPSGGLVVTLKPEVEVKGDQKLVHALALKTLPQNVQIIRDLYANLENLLREGIVKPNRVELLPNGLNGIVGGLKRMEEDKVSGVKLVALPKETV